MLTKNSGKIGAWLLIFCVGEKKGFTELFASEASLKVIYILFPKEPE